MFYKCLHIQRIFTPLDPLRSDVRIRDKGSIFSKTDKSFIFRGGDQTGFTLIEIILYVAVFVIVAAIMVVIFTTPLHLLSP